jgi:opacity protein-like surface antigen
MKKLLLGLLAAASFASSVNAGPYENQGQHGAGRWPNWYVGLKGSINYVDDTSVTRGNVGAGTVDFDSGYGVAGAIGYTPGPTGTLMDYTRLEFEIGHRFNDLDQLAAGGTFSNIAGEVKSYSYMANVYFDFDTKTQVSPYVGAGIGLDTVTLDSRTVGVNDSDRVFAYQFMAGLGWQPEFLLNTVLQFGYKYHASSDPTFTTNTGQSFEHEYSTHALEAGARFRF